VTRVQTFALILLAGCGTGPAENPFRAQISISSVKPGTDCIITWALSSAAGDTGFRLVYHVWVGPDTGSQIDRAFFIRLGVTDSQSMARPGIAQPMKWELSVVRPRPGFSDPSDPNFGVADPIWLAPYGGNYRRLNYTCGTAWSGI